MHVILNVARAQDIVAVFVPTHTHTHVDSQLTYLIDHQSFPINLFGAVFPYFSLSLSRFYALSHVHRECQSQITERI